MKRYNLLFLLLLLPCLAFGQEVLQSFDTALDSSYWAYEHVPSSTQTFTNLFLANDITKVGSGSMKVDWAVQGTESYGGYSNIMHGADSTDVFDFSPYTHLKVWYYNASPQTLPGTTQFRILLKDMSNVAVANRTMANIGQSEFWYSHFFILDSQPGWNELVLPLVDVQQQSDQGVWLPGWAGQAGNSQLDLDAIKAWKFEWSIDASVYDAANPQNSGTSAGTIYFDNLALYGHAFPVINYFDTTSTATNATFYGTGTSSIGVIDNTQNAFEDAAAQYDWKVDASESWGGWTSFTYAADGFLADMRGNTHMTLRYNNMAASDMPGNVVFRIQLHEYSEGDNSEEVWIFQENAILEGPAGWNKLMIPLEDRGTAFPNAEGFSNPGWSGTAGNGKLDLDKVKSYEIGFSAATQGTVTKGTILFDNFELYGKRQTDFEPPAAPQGVGAVPDATGNFNLVIWTDVPGEAGEKYAVYASQNPITDVHAPGVEVLADGIAENIQTYVHYLFYPLQDKQVTYYYAVEAMDKVGNIGPAGVSATGVNNNAKGVATISLNPPANFAADGDLTEWENSGIKPFIFKKSVSHTATGAFDNDDDLTITMYMAMDQQYLYFAVDAIDNVFSYDPTGANWWEDDAIEMFFGLYDGRPGPPHLARLRGERPDYSLQFRYDGLINSDNGNRVIYNRDSTSSYYFEGLGASDYIIETRVRLSDITFGSDAPFVPVNGMRLPLDFSIHDSDSPNVRDGVMSLSPINNDNSWSSPRNWTYVWIGNQESPTAVKDKGTDGVPLSYNLSQNYPNPFNPTTKISYAIRKPGLVRIELYNTLGQKVRTLVDEAKPAGTYTFEIQANNLPSGVYFYRINAGDFKQTKKMLLMK
jgi:Secretion system C-terminal sorting domain/Carbohydrate family 9 binding domain-like